MTISEDTVRMVSKKRAAELLDVSVDFIDSQITKGALPAWRLGDRVIRIALADLHAYATSLTWDDL